MIGYYITFYLDRLYKAYGCLISLKMHSSKGACAEGHPWVGLMFSFIKYV